MILSPTAEKLENLWRKFCKNRNFFIKIMKYWPKIVIFTDF